MRVLFVTVVNVFSLRNINYREVFQFQLSRQPSIRTETMLNDTTNIANADIRCPSIFLLSEECTELFDTTNQSHLQRWTVEIECI